MSHKFRPDMSDDDIQTHNRLFTKFEETDKLTKKEAETLHLIMRKNIVCAHCGKSPLEASAWHPWTHPKFGVFYLSPKCFICDYMF